MSLVRIADTIWFRQIFAPPLALLSLVFELVVRLRATLYKWGIIPSDSCGAFVVSLGNLQAGGTGKTPIAEFLASRWRTRTRLGIVSRGYGRTTRGSHRVPTPGVGSRAERAEAVAKSAALYGDEPTLLSERLGTDIPIQVGERRLTAARDLIVSEGVPLILLDDGFQHMELRRSFDYVLIDLSAPAWHFRLLPWGRLREPLAALDRADAVLLTKTEGLSEEKIKSFERQIRRIVDVPVIRFQQVLSWEGAELQPGDKVIAVAGLARPEVFFGLVRAHSSKPELLGTIAFKDHHVFESGDVDRILELARSVQARKVLVTEKDAVKLAALWPKTSTEGGTANALPTADLVVSRLEVRPAREFDKEQLELVDEIILGSLPKPKR